MSNTKFIKVDVSERLPEKDKELFIINSENEIFHGYLSPRNNWIIYGLKNAGNIQYFLEEVPDRESELIEMLERLVENDMLSHEGDRIVENLLKTFNQ